MKATEQKLQKALGISSDTYAEMMYEYGCAYLEQRKENLITDCKCKEDQAEKFTAIFRNSTIWWNWWRREWQAVDRLFLRLNEHRMEDYRIMQECHTKIPPLDEVDLILDNHVIIKDLSKAALLLTEKKMPYNDDSKSILYTGRDKKVFPRQWI
ncbi:hypothetical protein BZG01_00045 [Labilibaculum manganireducens]|uniref:Uncharacterized protein n=1 Tax=Labilibaculum manganireducens TaxID=1940525 RepID=A0A2N3IGJ2_9BACT|nr:hypothetical protein [Labilibaculum manganireducens]PKQ69363.1 hypothetical protein BZG01_00045 [Labilibaculum manganireducens]